MPEENKILKLKYKSDPISKTPPAMVYVVAAKLLLKIHVITGWEVPQKELMDILVDQFCKKMMESYQTINPDEVEYAFRNKPADIKEWGKALSISIIDEVIIHYLEKRRAVSNIEEQKKTQIEYQPSEAEKKKIDEEYEAFKQTPLGKRLIPK